MATNLTFLCDFFGFVIWIFATNMGVLCFFAIIVGPVAGTYLATVSSVLAEIIGLKELPSGLSITWITLIPPTTVAEAIALALRDSSQHGFSYLRLHIFTACMYVGAAVYLWLVRGWKVRELALIERRDAITTSSYPKSSPNREGNWADSCSCHTAYIHRRHFQDQPVGSCHCVAGDGILGKSLI